MADFRITTQQAEIIATDEPRFIVRAAAGSGKTFVLVQRYLRHVLDENCDPRSVLAFTFTAKAAAEMRTRVVERLRERNRPELAQAVETGPISTIHAFCERLLRENALEAGLDPEFTIATEADSAEMQRLAVREVLTLPDGHLSTEASALIGELTGKMEYGSTGPYDFLEKAVYQVLGDFRGSGLSPSDLEANADDLPAMWHQHMLRNLPAEFGERLATVIGKPGFYPALQEHARALGITRPGWLKDSASSMEPTAAHHVAALGELAATAWLKLEAHMAERRHLDFAALERRAVRLLMESEPTATRARRTYRHVLVDEAQDLNPTQHRLIDAIAPISLMLVGDGQQSIYGFRQADLSTFERKANELRSWHLSKNHRSTDPILRFVDTVATSIWREKYTPMLGPQALDLDAPSLPLESDFDGVELWLSAKNATERNAARWIAELIAEGECASEIGVLVRGWNFGKRLVAELLRLEVPARLSGGVSRFYTRMEIRDLANALRVLADPSDNFSFIALLNSPIVGLSFDSIAVLAEHESVADALNGFEPPIADDKARLEKFFAWFEALSANSGRLSAWETLAELFAVSGYLEALASRPRSAETLANVRKLLTLAAERPELGPSEFAERIADVESLRHREAEVSTVDDNANAVTVLTTHSAKGLEFPVVILPDTHSNTISPKKSIEVDPRLPAFSVHFDGDPSPFHRFLTSRRHDREREEGARLLYVALTRARRRLAVVTHAQAGNDTFAGMVARAVGLSAKSTPVGYRLRQEPRGGSGDGTGNLG